MVAWMNRIAPACLRPGARVAVVGAGLGDDAVFLADRGYDVVGFDASAEAVAWAKRRHPGHAALFRRADVLDLPGGLMKRFDLVVEVHTLQALPPRFREELAAGLERLMCPRDGRLLVVCRGRPDAVALEEVEGPPFAFTPAELKETLSSAGLRLEGSLDDFEDDNSPPVRRLRGVFVHG
jgi:SAM-dependent methyltransferase